MNEFILLLLEKVCEAVYFALFMIYGKNLKKKRLLFIGIMIFEYLIITSLFQYNIWIHILYTFINFVNLKILYKSKSQITDVFLFMVASIIMMILSTIGYFLIFFTIKKYIVALILSRILEFLFLFIFKNKINYYYNKFYRLWNRHKDPKKIRSLTLRNISIIIFNLMFYVLNLALIISLLIGKR